MAIDVSLKELIAAGAHFGHQTRRWNPRMEEYLYGEKDGIHIFDLTKTKPLLEEALDVLKNASKTGKTILLVGTKKQVKDKLAEVAREANCFYVNERWLGGTLTNFEQIKKTTRRLTELKKGLETNEFSNRTKRERLLIQRDVERLERFFGGIEGMQNLPDFLFIVDTRREKTAVKEADMKGVTTIAIVDSNSDPMQVDYPIPMNDDASRALEYVLESVKEAILEGKKGDKRQVTSKKKKSQNGT